MASCDPKYLFVISFTVGKEAGIALVAAGSERQAFEILQNSGNYNGFPEKYVLVQSRNIGLIASVAYGLLIESYVNAMEAYDAIIKAANKLVGPKGDTGEKGEKGDTGDRGPAGVTSVRVTVDQTTGYPYAETSLIGGVLSIIFHGIKGEKGEKGERGDMGDISFDDVPTEGSDNLLTSGALYIAFNDKVSVIPGKGLSTNDYTNADKNKLTAIEAGAQKNVKSDWNAASGDAQILNKPDLSAFITKTVNDLTNYYTKSQTFTKEEVQSLIAGIRSFTYELVSVLPTASSSTLGAIYLVPSSDPQTQNVKDEYITIQQSGSYSWEQIGSTAIDLSGYVTTTALNTALASYVTSSTFQTAIAAKQDTISDLATIRSGASAGATAYQKPSGGIPSTDLASAVNTLLQKGVASVTSQQDGTVVITLSNGDTYTVDLNHVHPQYYSKVADTTQPSGGFVPDVVYKLGTLTGTVTFSLAAAVTGNVNHYFWSFDTGSTAPTVTWPSGITWADGTGPTVAASKHYEISILDGIATYAEV